MPKFALICIMLFPGLAVLAADPPQVHVDPSVPSVPRPLEPQTERAAVRDYVQSWQLMATAFEQNRADLLSQDFVGAAMDKLSSAIKEQSALGMSTHYRDVSHDIQFLFYSPEGLSIEFVDTVKFDVQVFDRGRLVATRHENARYLVVLSPAEVRWRVRVFQALHS